MGIGLVSGILEFNRLDHLRKRAFFKCFVCVLLTCLLSFIDTVAFTWLLVTPVTSTAVTYQMEGGKHGAASEVGTEMYTIWVGVVFWSSNQLGSIGWGQFIAKSKGNNFPSTPPPSRFWSVKPFAIINVLVCKDHVFKTKPALFCALAMRFSHSTHK